MSRKNEIRFAVFAPPPPVVVLSLLGQEQKRLFYFQVVSFLDKDELCTCNEFAVFEAAVNWISQNPIGGEDTEKLLKLVPYWSCSLMLTGIIWCESSISSIQAETMVVLFGLFSRTIRFPLICGSQFVECTETLKAMNLLDVCKADIDEASAYHRDVFSVRRENTKQFSPRRTIPCVVSLGGFTGKEHSTSRYGRLRVLMGENWHRCVCKSSVLMCCTAKKSVAFSGPGVQGKQMQNPRP